MRVNNATGIRNLCEVAVHLQKTMQVNAATKFAIRTVLREAINKSNKSYKGNVNRNNCRFISHNSEQLLSKDPGVPLISDHALPVSIALREFENLEELTLDNVVELVSRYSVMVLITPEEDAKLRDNGLVKKMPIDWNGQDLLARYERMGIKVKPNKIVN